MADDEYTMHFASRLYEQLQIPLSGGATQAKAVIQVFLNDLLDVERMAYNPAKVQGYTPQPDAKVALVNSFKEDEERLLRKLDAMVQRAYPVETIQPTTLYDMESLMQAKEHFKIAWMLLNRAVFQPTRIKLPEDE